MKEYVIQFWFVGDYDNLEYDFDTMKEAEYWLAKQTNFDEHDMKIWEEYGWRIMKIVKSGNGRVKA